MPIVTACSRCETFVSGRPGDVPSLANEVCFDLFSLEFGALIAFSIVLQSEVNT